MITGRYLTLRSEDLCVHIIMEVKKGKGVVDILAIKNLIGEVKV